MGEAATAPKGAKSEASEAHTSKYTSRLLALYRRVGFPTV